MTEQDVLDQQAYILFYEQCEDQLVEEILE